LRRDIDRYLRHRNISWYYEYFLHPGQTRTEQTIRNTMTQDVAKLCSLCAVCQLSKKERSMAYYQPGPLGYLIGPFTIIKEMHFELLVQVRDHFHIYDVFAYE
jgi:hypothetical protein